MLQYPSVDFVIVNNQNGIHIRCTRRQLINTFHVAFPPVPDIQHRMEPYSRRSAGDARRAAPDVEKFIAVKLFLLYHYRPANFKRGRPHGRHLGAGYGVTAQKVINLRGADAISTGALPPLSLPPVISHAKAPSDSFVGRCFHTIGRLQAARPCTPYRFSSGSTQW